MQLGDFQKAPRGPYAFDHWLSIKPVPSPVGDFTVELQTKDALIPDDEMLREATVLTQAFEHYSSEVLARIHEHYQQLQDRPDWLEDCGVPEHLSPMELKPYLRLRSLVVSREERNGEISYSSGVYISPMWDIEHGIHLELTDQGVFFEQ